MWHTWHVKHTFVILRLALIVGLVLSPLYSRAFGKHEFALNVVTTQVVSEQALSDTAMVDEAMPCHESGKPDCGHCGKNCPCMTVCMAMSIQGLPIPAVAMAAPAVGHTRRGIISAAQLASLTASPPARPPRA